MPRQRRLGRIVGLQVQSAPLKIERGARSYYDPAPLCPVEHLLISRRGAIGLSEIYGAIQDVHHMDHPRSRNRRGKNGISLGFTSHYDAMRAHFGEHLLDGRAGENILVETAELVPAEELRSGVLIIESVVTGRQLCLVHLKVAAPCEEFTRFALGEPEMLPAAQMKAALQFLNSGMRGFYATLAEEGEFVVAPGDCVFVLAEAGEPVQTNQTSDV